MVRKTALAVLIGLMAPAILLAGMKFYEVVPYRNYIGLTDSVPPNNQISQTFINVVDSLEKVSIWVGDVGNGARYFVEIRDHENTLIASGDSSPGTSSWRWLDINLSSESNVKPVRGKTYKAVISRADGAPISYAYDPTDPYKHGNLFDPSWVGPPWPADLDLAARVYGIAQTENSKDLFGSHLFQLAMWRDWRQGANPVEGWDAWSDAAAAVGIGWAREGLEWGSVQSESGASFSFAYKYDTAMLALATRGIKPFVILCYTPKWASSRIEGFVQRGDTVDTIWSGKCPPRNLFEPVMDPGQPGAGVNPNNFWANYVYHAVKRYGPSGEFWGVQPYPDFAVTRFGVWNEPDIRFFWRKPTGHYQPQQGDTFTDQEMCSLYARLVVVTDSAAKIALAARGQPRSGIKLYAGSNWSANWPNWLADFGVFDHVEGNEIHPYQLNFDELNRDTLDPQIPPYYPASLDNAVFTIRQVLASRGLHDKEVLITEIGWPARNDIVADQANQANALLATYVHAQAEHMMWGRLQAPLIWFSFCNYPKKVAATGWVDYIMGTLRREDDTLPGPPGVPKKAFYAQAQLAAVLPGMRMHGRYLLGTPQDDNVRIYEFEDPHGKRMWIGWVNDDTVQVGDIIVSIPVRSDAVSAEELHYVGNEQPSSPTPGANGWLTQTLTTRPVFISEAGDISRPDLVVDSIRLVPAQPQVGMPLTMSAFIRNLGSPVPGNPPGGVAFYWNDSLLTDSVVPWDTIHDGTNTLVFMIGAVPIAMQGVGLVRATANPGQEFVELGLDDNSAYRRLAILPEPFGGDDQ